MAAPLLSACSSSDSDDNEPKGTVKIGLVVPQNGANKAVGDEMRNGFELFRNLNASRFGGYNVELIAADEGESADSAKAAVEKLVKEDKVLAVSGISTSLALQAVRETVETAHIPLVASNSSPKNLLNALYVWRTSYVDDEPGAALGEFVATRLSGSGTAFVIAPDPIGKDAATGFLSTFQPKGGKVQETPVYTPAGTNDFTQWLNPLKGGPTRAIVSFYTGAAGQTFVKQYADLGLKNTAQLYAPGFLTEGPALLKAQGEAAKGVFTSMNYSPDLDNSANRRFVAEYQKAHRVSPTTYAMASYDAAAVLDKALSLVDGELSGETLNAAIGRVGQINSPRGGWQFNQIRSPQQRWFLRQVRLDGAVLANNIISELATIG
jgi:branched-chain amino acid transport system substrate-binding protein